MQSTSKLSRLFWLALAVLPATLAAAEPREPIRLTISPAPLPEPPLRYRLRPAPSTDAAGDTVRDYLRALIEHRHAIAWLRDDKLWRKIGDDWQLLPAEKLPKEEVQTVLKAWESAFDALKSASRRDERDRPFGKGDWRTLGEGFDHSDMREIARYLNLKVRFELGRKKWTRALETLTVMLRFSRDIGRGGSHIDWLVGSACGSSAFSVLEEWVQQPGAPNLYWALAEFPRPVLPIEVAIDGERAPPVYGFEGFDRFRAAVLPHEEAQRLSETFYKTYSEVADGDPPKPRPLNELIAEHLPRAKQALIDAGRKQKDVESMSPHQVIWLDADLERQRYFDNIAKWAQVPAPQRRAQRKPFVAGKAPLRLDRVSPVLLDQSFDFRDRRDQEWAMLQVVEAIRYHASKHDKLPARLADIAELPIPEAAFSGGPFVYELKDGEAKLSAKPVSNVEYVDKSYAIRLRK